MSEGLICADQSEDCSGPVIERFSARIPLCDAHTRQRIENRQFVESQARTVKRTTQKPRTRLSVPIESMPQRRVGYFGSLFSELPGSNPTILLTVAFWLTVASVLAGSVVFLYTAAKLERGPGFLWALFVVVVADLLLLTMVRIAVEAVAALFALNRKADRVVGMLGGLRR
jgi:hypothetical protein